MFAGHEDLRARLDRQLVERDEPPSHVLAREQLRKVGVEALEICLTLPDSIVYRNQAGRVMTAWTNVLPNNKFELVAVAAGMPAWAPED